VVAPAKRQFLQRETTPRQGPHPSSTALFSNEKFATTKAIAQSLATAIRRLDRTISSIAPISLLAADILGKTTRAQRAAADATESRVLGGPWN
jgi:hypothetical protein